MKTPLKSDNPLILVYTLTDKLIDTIRSADDLGGEDIAARTQKLRDAIWPQDKKSKPTEEIRRVFRDALDGLDKEGKSKLFEAYARLGHLYEIAGLTARHNFFKKQVAAPAGVNEFVKEQTSVQAAVGKLNQPVFEVTMTMHPTNTHSLEAMRAQRALSKALEQGDEAAVDAVMQTFARTSVLHQRDGADANFTVRDETGVIVHFLDNLYEDITAAYGQFDTALTRKFSETYQPEDLDLKLKLGSWGSAGDKDGNHNVTAEATLEAIALHMSAITGHYKDELASIDSPKLAGWKETIEKAEAALKYSLLRETTLLRRDSNEVRRGHKKIDAEDLAHRFNELTKEVSAVYRSLDAEAFAADLKSVYQESKDDKALDLLRKVRLFGFHFAKIEYRETAEEYERVVDVVVPGYHDLKPAQKVARMTELLQQEGNEPGKLFQGKIRDITEQGATQSYSEDSAMPIAYHTMKRMDLARDFPGFIQDNVLAECGRLDGQGHSQSDVVSQGVANILEAQFVQRMMPEENGRRARLGIVPLFEEPGTMMNIDNIMRGAYDNPAYASHMKEIAQERGEKPTQQVQIAHSDNARRSGLLAARAYIHEAHKKMRVLNDEKNIVTQFFEGGSISDSYRNGVRAVSASVNAFDLHDFAKFTFQGGDLVNYFTAPSSTVRLLTRNITHGANRFEQKDGQWKVKKRTPFSEEAEAARVSDNDNRKPNRIMDEIAVAALKETLADYQDDDFRKDTMGVLLALLDYSGETKAGGRGSRAAARGTPATLEVAESTQSEGAVRLPHLAGGLTPVNIEKVRTIGFSEAWQHAGIVPSWIGSQKLADHLLEDVKKKHLELQPKSNKTEAERHFLTQFGSVGPDSTALAAKQIKLLYEKSPTFRDAEDRSAFALAMTDPESFKWMSRKLEAMQERLPDNGEVKQGIDYLHHVEDTYRRAGALAYASLSGKDLPGDDVRASVSSVLPHLKDDMRHKAAYRDFILYAKMQGASDHQRGVLHNAGDTVVHGRFLAADDPAYGQARQTGRSI